MDFSLMMHFFKIPRIQFPVNIKRLSSAKVEFEPFDF